MALWQYRRRQLIRRRIFLGTVLFLLSVILVRYFIPSDSTVKIREDTHKIALFDHLSGQVVELGLEEYVVGVVAAEMPASFHPEALKAQAVAARTYAVKRLQLPDPRVKALHPQADLSTDHTINQAWISDAEMRKRWGKWNYAAYKKKIIEAVEETWGLVMLYEGQLIDPVYHASCGGKGTENSGDVWKYHVPYLQRVECSGHPENNHEAVVTMSLNDFIAKMGVQPQVPAGKIFGNAKVLQITERTESGRVKNLVFGGQSFTGAELRSKLDLKSTLIVGWEIEGSTVKFSTLGYGHGVGMCQYGAGAMAEAGHDFRQILSHYYQGVTLGRIK